MQFKYFARLHFYPALRISLIVLAVGLSSDFWAQHHNESPYFSNLLSASVVFFVFSFLSFRHQEAIAGVEAYQSNAFLMHLKINGALTKINGVLELCEHGEHTLNHENCKAAIRKQIRVIQGALGFKPEAIKKEFETIPGGTAKAAKQNK